ncbi:cysteine-rich receptor-like protein kinase 2 [Neltuma alba]|uniref:cysteine-rich receptor-like protein kinase 2 n=1 Tax=Neltuma alba TaxID=207710 RepID=UPI0010A57922|nr:cysteine-rich receptor-like protein kinase 2 [Prosopis alba]
MVVLKKKEDASRSSSSPSSFIFIFCSCCSILNGVVSDPQTNLLKSECNPSFVYLVSSISIFDRNLNATLRDIRGQISEQNKHFATAHEGNGGNPVSTLLQCRNYLSIADCLDCFDVAAARILSCTAGASGAHVVYDGCFLRFDISGAFLDETTQTFNTAYCGNQTEDDDGATRLTSVAQQLLMNLQTVTPNIRGSSAAMKMTVSNVGPTIYAFAQYGRAFADGCFMRYSTTSFFPDNQTIDIVPAFKQGSSNKGAIAAGVVSGAALALLLVALFAWMRRTKSPKRVPRGEIPGASKLKGSITFSYKDLKSATKNFSDENKIGEGGFGVVYKGILGNGKVVAVKKLALRASNRIDEDFESEVMLISNVHHRNLVRLLGSCSKGHDRILVYEYMKNNSLDRFLFEDTLHQSMQFMDNYPKRLIFIVMVLLS